jgi:hypothetical protein
MTKRRASAFAHTAAFLAQVLLSVGGGHYAWGQEAPPRAYVPREGRKDPALKARMTQLLVARGIRPVEVRIVEPEWQVERRAENGSVRGRTINAAVVTRDPKGGGRALRFVLFRCDTERGRGLRFGPPRIDAVGPPRPL